MTYYQKHFDISKHYNFLSVNYYICCSMLFNVKARRSLTCCEGHENPWVKVRELTRQRMSKLYQYNCAKHSTSRSIFGQRNTETNTNHPKRSDSPKYDLGLNEQNAYERWMHFVRLGSSRISNTGTCRGDF